MRRLTSFRHLLDRTAFFTLVRFGLVGCIASGVYLSVGLLASSAQWPIVAAHALASVVSLAVSYVGQKTFTFRVRGALRRTAMRFTFASAVIIATQTALVWVLDGAGAGDALILVLSTAYYPLLSLAMHAAWTFRSPAGAPAAVAAPGSRASSGASNSGDEAGMGP